MKFFPDIEVCVGDGDITGDDDVRREDVPVDPGAEGDIQEARGVGPDQGVHPLHVVSAGIVGPGQVDDRYGVDAGDSAGYVEELLVLAGDGLRADEDVLRRIEHQDFLLLEILVHKTGDFALVSSGEPVIRLDDSQGSVLLVGVIVGHVVQVELVLEQLPDNLGTFLHAGHPLIHWDGRPIEIPLEVQLGLLLVKVGEVAVQHQLGARLDHLRTSYPVNVD